MRIRSFIIAYGLVVAILLFADRRSSSAQPDRYSRVVDLTAAETASAPQAAISPESGTRIVSPAAMIPGTWNAGQIPPGRLIAPLVVMNVKAAPEHAQVTLDDIAEWETRNGPIPQGAVVAIRGGGNRRADPGVPLPLTADAAEFLMDARYVLGFAVETSANLAADRTLARQLALHGDYVVERAARFAVLPETGSLVIVAPAKNQNTADAPVRVLAMVR
jgi:kynurenine formamidase